MINNSRLISGETIQELLANDNYADAAELLLTQQKVEWVELKQNSELLKKIKTKTISFKGFIIKVQYNPGRIKSTSADVDEKTILNRNCFLCDKNLPPEQKGLIIFKDYFLYCNPHPVFPEHYTVISKDHKPQEIISSFFDFIEISKRLSSRYSLIYNGPKCGASAPDHLHFQAGTKNFMPFEDDFYSFIKQFGYLIFGNTDITVSAVDDGLRKFFSFESKDEDTLQNTFLRFYNNYENLSNRNEEPLMNIICNYEREAGWRVIIFLRNRHRPSHYFREKRERILFSPAAIDLGGMCITPLEKDFENIDRKLLEEIFKEVFPTKEEFEQHKSSLGQILNS